MNGGATEAASTAVVLEPLEWKFAQVFGEQATGEEVQEGTISDSASFQLS